MEELKEGIYKITIPFENIYTSSFILVNGEDAIILDSGSSDDDAIKYIIPKVAGLGVIPRFLVSTHTHGDHHGGIAALKRAYPGAQVCLFSRNEEDAYRLEDGEILLKRFKMLNLPGHSSDSLGVLDMATNTLISGDSLQLFGVGRYGTSVCDFKAYYKTIDRVRDLNLDAVYASHEYVPLGFRAEGEEIEAYLQECVNAAEYLRIFAGENKDIDCNILAEIYNNTHPDLPPVNYMTIQGALEKI